MDPNSYHLHHFTREFNTLKLILQPGGGFWPRYSMEDFSWTQGGESHYLAVPCTCFCDLPLELTPTHREDYGNYVISFDKSSDLAKSLTPLVYVNEDGPLAQQISSHYGGLLRHFSGMSKDPDGKMHFVPTMLDAEKLDGLLAFLPYLKSSLGHTLQRRPPPPGGKYDKMPDYDFHWQTKYLEEEFEWRYVPSKHRDRIFCFADYARWEMQQLSALSGATTDSFLEFAIEEVEGIIVEHEGQRNELYEIHDKLKGKVQIWAELPRAP
jgi:hypothetical protein